MAAVDGSKQTKRTSSVDDGVDRTASTATLAAAPGGSRTRRWRSPGRRSSGRRSDRPPRAIAGSTTRAARLRRRPPRQTGPTVWITHRAGSRKPAWSWRRRWRNRRGSRQAASSSGPAARWIAPSTPPPPSSDSFAALTIASVVSAVMSPWTTSMHPRIDSMASVLADRSDEGGVGRRSCRPATRGCTSRSGTDTACSSGAPATSSTPSVRPASRKLPQWPWLRTAVAAATDRDVVLDGEVIAYDDEGRHTFQSVGRADRDHAFVVFDLLVLDGEDVRDRPWSERRSVARGRCARRHRCRSRR